MILEDFFNNGIYPFEEIVPKDSEYKRLGQKISQERTYFESILSDKDIKRMEEYDNLFVERATIDCRENFVYGFRLGALLMVDVFLNSEK